MIRTTVFTPRNYLLAAAAVATIFALSACADANTSGTSHSGASSAPAPESSAGGSNVDFNLADASFAQMMIPHHEQAVEMSDILLAKTGVDARVVELAEQIKAAQAPEIEQLTEWLEEWDAPADPMAGMDHSMDGMMSAEDMDALVTAEGAEAGRLFLEQMIVHHEGAIEMAKVEQLNGQNSRAVAMADAIVATQGDEIALMKEILG